MLMVSAIILTYTCALLLIVLPQVESSTCSLEEKNSKEVLNKVLLIAKNMHLDLENFKKHALQYHETELRNLTDAFWSIVETKYEQSRPENIGSILQARGKKFQKDLLRFYNKNKTVMSTEELKQAIINYVNIFRYDNGSGYFFIHKQTTVVEHPIYPEFKGRDFADIKDQNGVYFVREFYERCRKNGSGIVHYQWKHAETQQTEDKVAYVFTFEPFDWIIGTSASIRALQNSLKDEVIYLANTIRYGRDNYFFINGYDYRVIAHPYIKKDTDYSEERDVNGTLIVPPMVNQARKNGQGFTRYQRKDPKGNSTFEKLTFSKDFPDWQMVISTGSSIDDIRKEIDKRKSELIEQLRRIMSTTTIGKSGYLFIVDDQATMIIHRNKYMEGKDITTMKNPSTGNPIFNDLKKAAEAGRPFYFKWDKPTDKGNYIYDKVAWVEYVPELHWYITSSAYVDELQATSNQLKHGIVLLGLSILLLAFLLSFLFFRNLLKPISTLSTLAGQVTRGDFSARSTIHSNDEIGVLSREFNTMVDTIENNIHILDQKVAEKTQQVEKQNKTFAALFYESSDGILLLQGGLFIDCNRAAYQMLKYDNKQELIALPPTAISPKRQPDGKDSQEKADEMIQIALDRGSNRFEWVHLCKDGSETFVEIVLTRIVIRDDALIHVVWRDINAKKAAERLLQKTVNEFGAVMDAIDYGVLFMDDQLHVRIANQAFRDIWDIPADFVSRHPTMRELMEFNRYNDLYPITNNDFDQYMDAREQEVHNGAIAPTLLTRNDGMILQYQCIVLPDNWRMLTYFDVTELKNTQDQLSRAQKMEAIGMMAGGVAHDLNNILSGIVSYPELLLLQLPEDSSLRKPLEEILDSGKRAATVVADLLTVARGAASTREPHDLNTLIHEYLHSPEWRKLQSLHPGIRCTQHLDAKQPIISCSPVHIKKTAMNLLTNAMEAIGAQGEVRIATSNLEIADDDCPDQDIPPGRYVIFTVQDSGPGISSEDLDHIFEPFYSRKVIGRSGTGLGLTVVWNTVEEHGGRILVKSSEQGTLFTLYFPISADKIKPEEEARPALLATTKGEHILIVDDEPQLRDIASQILTSLGYTVSTVASGEKAITFTKEHSVDLLMIDMLMDPGINGRRTYKRILQFKPEQKALVASGFSESDDVKATLKMGACGFIKKPYSIYQLAGAVKEALESSG